MTATPDTDKSAGASSPYERFLKLCQASDKLMVWAGETCPNSMCPECFAYYRKNNDSDHIWVRRDNTADVFVAVNSSAEQINGFIKGSPSPTKELSLLSHEYGHYVLDHCGIVDRSTLEKCKTEYQDEVDAWSEGRRILEQVEFEDWHTFEIERRLSLEGYLNGFKTLFPAFSAELVSNIIS